MHDDLEQRKSQHLDLAVNEEVEPSGSDPLLRCVRLVHSALPELSLDQVDVSTRLCGVALRAPLMIVGMTGGTARASRINQDLALLAQEEGIAFGVGSMRIVLREPERLSTFDVRPARPPLLFANLGAQQLAQTPDAAPRLIELLGADGICIHLNPAQELVQADGDRDFRGCLDAIGALARTLGDKLVVKETGCGISPAVARMLRARGVRAIDVSGLGGTSWTRVEQLRAATPEARALGTLLSEWGIPTAAAIAACNRAVGADVQLIASGGVRTGLDAVRALALGATVAGFALPMLRAHHRGGIEAARAELRGCIAALKAACLLCGAKDLAALRARPKVLLEPLAGWVAQLDGAGATP
ncbi:MAG: type 2 isopentenyl-diphosphate Delta-isomerase [Myxococcales bacterium]